MFGGWTAKLYAAQLRGIQAYRSEPAIPQDPYDIPVALAQRLQGFRSITLDPAQQASYSKATTLAHEHGPCCCRCWRWDAFEGQAKYLIAAHQYDAVRIAAVRDLEDGLRWTVQYQRGVTSTEANL